MKSKALFTVTSDLLIDKLKKEGIENFVYPLSFFCVGIPNTFTVDEMHEENSFIYVNRVLDTKSMEELKVILNNLPSNIKGIIFDDLGLIEVLKDSKLIKILANIHFNTSYASVNEYLKYVDEIIVSPDITEEEIDEIIAKADKKVSLMIFGLISSLYSRRSLLSNHQIHNNIPKTNSEILRINDKHFLAYENEFGTVLYHYPYYNASRLINKNISYAFYFPIFLSDEDAVKCARNDFTGIPNDEGFLDTKTIYRVKERGESK